MVRRRLDVSLHADGLARPGAPSPGSDPRMSMHPAHSEEHCDVLVLGAGAAGLMGAITAGQRGLRVFIIDRAERIGKKILISGGGRCNFTNLDCTAEISFPPIRTSRAPRSPATPPRISSRWSNATASRITRKLSASSSATVPRGILWPCSKRNAAQPAYASSSINTSPPSARTRLPSGHNDSYVPGRRSDRRDGRPLHSKDGRHRPCVSHRRAIWHCR